MRPALLDCPGSDPALRSVPSGLLAARSALARRCVRGEGWRVPRLRRPGASASSAASVACCSIPSGSRHAASRRPRPPSPQKSATHRHRLATLGALRVAAHLRRAPHWHLACGQAQPSPSTAARPLTSRRTLLLGSLARVRRLEGCRANVSAAAEQAGTTLRGRATLRSQATPRPSTTP